MTQPPQTLGYAEQSSSGALPATVRALSLLLPNLMAAIILFLPLHEGEAPVGPIVQYAGDLFRVRGRAPTGMVIWEAMITGPFLLGIPLALWTIRLSMMPRAGAAERAVAWSITLVSLTMTILCLAYCVTETRFRLAVGVAIVVFAVGSFGVAMLWPLRRAWPMPLIAMTTAWAVNTTLTAFVVLSHAPWSAGIVIGLFVVGMQLIIGSICVRRWRVRAAMA